MLKYPTVPFLRDSGVSAPNIHKQTTLAKLRTSPEMPVPVVSHEMHSIGKEFPSPKLLA